MAEAMVVVVALPVQIVGGNVFAGVVFVFGEGGGEVAGFAENEKEVGVVWHDSGAEEDDDLFLVEGA